MSKIISGYAERFAELEKAEDVFAFLDELLLQFGADRYVISGLPLPGRSIDPLVLVLRLEEVMGTGPRSGLLDPTDPLLQRARDGKVGFAWTDKDDAGGNRPSGTAALIRGETAHAVGVVPIWHFHPWQGALVIAGERMKIDDRHLAGMDWLVRQAFRRLFALGAVRRERQGELSAQERRVVSLAAVGKTAVEIAEVLAISQRTVHAHLQNASDKLRATNKTHTVVEALRYGQISL